MGMIETIFGKVVDEHGNMKNIDTVHERVHAGKHWTATGSTSASAGSTTYYLVFTPQSSVSVHFIAEAGLDVGGHIHFYRNSVASSSLSTTNISINNNNNGVTSTSCYVGIVPTSSYISDMGQLLECHIVGSVSPVSRFGGSAGNRHEWVLKSSSKYMITITSTVAFDSYVNMYWYEETE